MRGLWGWVVVLVVALWAGQAHAQGMWQYQEDEARHYFRGFDELRWAGWGTTQAKVEPIILQLMEDTGEVFRVVPGQGFLKGQAHSGGWIVIDLSVAHGPREVLAFWLAREWAHEHLGHPPSLYRPFGAAWRSMPLPNSDEDLADLWAAAFLKRRGYDIEPVIEELLSLPLPPDPARSTPKRRAAAVREAYDAVLQDPGEVEPAMCDALCPGVCEEMCPSECSAMCPGTCPGSCPSMCDGWCPGPLGPVPCGVPCMAPCLQSCMVPCTQPCVAPCQRPCMVPCKKPCLP